MVKYRIAFTKQAEKDKKLLKGVKLDKKAIQMLEKMEEDPYYNHFSFEPLSGDLSGLYSRRDHHIEKSWI